MRLARALCYACVVFLCSTCLSAQQPAATTAIASPSAAALVQRDPQAVAIIERSLAALGGASQIGQIADCKVEVQVQAPPGSSASSGTAVYKFAGGEYRADSTTAAGTQTLASGHGKPFAVANGTTKGIPPHVMRAAFSPTVAAIRLLNDSNDANYSFRYKGTGSLGSAQVSIVEISSQATWLDAMVSPQTWYFDSGSGLPLRIEYWAPDIKNPRHHVECAADLSEYRVVSGVEFPFQFTTSVNGAPFKTMSVTSVQTNTGILPSAFDATTGGAQ